MLKHKPDFLKIPCSFVLFLSIFTIVGSVGDVNGSVHRTYYRSACNILNGTCLSGSFPYSVTNVDADYLMVRSVGTDIEDYVGNNMSDVDNSAGIGAHSNFTAQQYGPDLISNTLTEGNTGGNDTIWLYADADDENRIEWTRVGMNPYLNAIDYSTNFVNVSGNNKLVGDFSFADSGKSMETVDNVEVQLYAKHSGDDNLEVFVWDGFSWASLGTQTTSSSWGWMNWTATTVLDTWTKVDGAKIYIRSKASTGTYEVDCARLQVGYNVPENYELDLEVQWTSVDYDELNEELCIYGGSMGGENIRVDVWNGSGWENLFNDLISGWSNVSVSPYLDSSIFTIRFKGDTETLDTTRDAWELDVVLIHVWTDASAQSFGWGPILLFSLAMLFGLLFFLVLILKRKKKTESHIERKTNEFSEKFGMTHRQMVGKKMLLEIDPTSDYHKCLLRFAFEAKSNNEPLFIFTNKNSTLHSALSGVENANFRLLTSGTSFSQHIDDMETLLPATDLSVVLTAFDEIKRGDEKPKNVLFDNFSDVILRCGFPKAYAFMCSLLETISSSKVTALLVFNPTAHDQTISSSVRGLIKNQLAYAKSGPKVGTL